MDGPTDGPIQGSKHDMNKPTTPSFAANPGGYGYAGGSFGAGGPPVTATPAAASSPAGLGAAAFDDAGGGAGAPLELVFDVTEAHFESQVLEQSMHVPVLLDCWAPWCGPCKSLGPVLEKLAGAYGGRFVLAKINTDEAPNISAALRIRSIPLVVLFIGGRPVDQFVGVQTEGQIRQFLDKHLKDLPPPGGGSPVEGLREEAKTAASPEEAEACLMEALSYEPGHPGATLDLAERFIARAALDDAAALLAQLPAAEKTEEGAGKVQAERHAALLKRIELARNKPPGDPQALTARIAANSKDHEARFALAALQVYEGDFKAAFDQLLEVVLRDKAEHRQRARTQLVEWFAVCPDADAVSHGRRYLGMYLN
jgi:putative thioredoxin